jgi:hypothetical protein
LKHIDDQLRLVGRHPQEHGGHLLVWLLQRHDLATHLVEVQEFFEGYDAHGLMTFRRYSSLQFHLLERDIFVELVKDVGFEIADLYGNYDHTPYIDESSPYMIWSLRRTTS